MLALETKQSGGKLLPNSDLRGGRGGVFPGEASRSRQKGMKIGTWNVTSLYIILGWISRRWDVGIWTGLGWPRIETVGGRL